MVKKLKPTFLFFFLLLLLLGVDFVYALEITYPRVPGAAPPQDFIATALPEDIVSLYIGYFFNLTIWLGGLIALTALIYGGLRYLTSTGKPEVLVSAKNQITAAFLGLLLLLSSFLILKALSPQFIAFRAPRIEPIEIEEKPEIALPVKEVKTSIDLEIPFGRIIEKIFESYISEPEPEQEIPRIGRIENNLETTKEIVDKLETQSENLKASSDACECFKNTVPDPPCNYFNCPPCPKPNTECSCDPCKPVREQIQNTEEDNQREINNLVSQQIKTEQEVASLKEWLYRLERAELLIKECPLRSLNSYAQFLVKKDYFSEQGWTIRELKFWDDISIVYTRPSSYSYGRWYPSAVSKITLHDFATFYCMVSGTFEPGQEVSFPTPSEEELDRAETLEEAEAILSESMACSSEAPVGEIIDRAKRVARLLINKLEAVIEKEKKLYDALDELQVSVSKCSSKNCNPQCICVSCGEGCTYCQEIGCFGEPCPRGEISNRLDGVKEISQEINYLINEITTIIEQAAPEILKDLETTIRYPMKHCVSKDWEQSDTLLFNCSQAMGANIPGGRVVYYCCETEKWEWGDIRRTVYGDCFEECYLEVGQAKHRACLNQCLYIKAEQLEDPDIYRCTHELNFYCCHIK